MPKLNFCITGGNVFVVFTRSKEHSSRVKIRPVRSRLMRKIVYALSNNKELVKW